MFYSLKFIFYEHITFTIYKNHLQFFLNYLKSASKFSSQWKSFFTFSLCLKCALITIATQNFDAWELIADFAVAKSSFTLFYRLGAENSAQIWRKKLGTQSLRSLIQSVARKKKKRVIYLMETAWTIFFYWHILHRTSLEFCFLQAV